MAKKSWKDEREWLKNLLAIATFIILWSLYYTSRKWSAPFDFLSEIIPDLSAGLLVVIVIYFLFKKQGFLNDDFNLNDDLYIIREQNESLLQKNNEIISNINNLYPDLKCVESFHENYYQYEWGTLINESKIEIIIIVYYFDTWLKKNEDFIINFLQNKDAKLKIVLSDPVKNIENIKNLFPDHSEAVLKEKINKTKELSLELTRKADVPQSRVEVYFFPRCFNYSIQIFDNRIAILSVFEMFRKEKVQSPVFRLNLDKSDKTKNFIFKEIDGIINLCQKVS